MGLCFAQIAMESIVTEIKEIKKQITSIMEDTNDGLDRLERKIDTIMEIVSGLSKINATVNEKFEMFKTTMALENEKNELKPSMQPSSPPLSPSPSSSSPPVLVDSVLIFEATDRQIRASNLIIFNLPETRAGTGWELDRRNVGEMFSTMGLQIYGFRCYRLGERGLDVEKRPRPLRVMMAGAQEVFAVLGMKAVLTCTAKWANIRMCSDRTQMQRDQMQALRNEVARRTRNGEKNLAIKYVNGVPSIIKLYY